MHIRFWGVRGSIASPGPSTAMIGGNTSCVEVTLGGRTFIFDAGTGLRALGQDLLARATKEAEVTMLLSHFHWDHIQGLPFFVPAYVPDFGLRIIGGTHDGSTLRAALESQMQAPGFPVSFQDLSARIDLHSVRTGQTIVDGDVEISVLKLNHPGGSYGYRLRHEGTSVVYATDTEHFACVDPAVRRFAEGADVLIYDAQYTPEEYAGVSGPSRVGWGHSTYVSATELAKAAGVGELVLFHHDPSRDDDGVLGIEEKARVLFSPTRAAREGASLHVSVRRAA